MRRLRASPLFPAQEPAKGGRSFPSLVCRSQQLSGASSVRWGTAGTRAETPHMGSVQVTSLFLFPALRRIKYHKSVVELEESWFLFVAPVTLHSLSLLRWLLASLLISFVVPWTNVVALNLVWHLKNGWILCSESSSPHREQLCTFQLSAHQPTTPSHLLHTGLSAPYPHPSHAAPPDGHGTAPLTGPHLISRASVRAASTICVHCMGWSSPGSCLYLHWSHLERSQLEISRNCQSTVLSTLLT